MNTERAWLNFSKQDRNQILNTLREDVELLKKFNLMDYSLLLCIQENPEYEKSKTYESKSEEEKI